MFKLFNRKKSKLQLFDLNDNILVAGDIVMAHRYDLGRCTLIEEDGHFYYESHEDQKRMSWVKMIDAITEKQKVEKIEE